MCNCQSRDTLFTFTGGMSEFRWRVWGNTRGRRKPVQWVFKAGWGPVKCGGSRREKHRPGNRGDLEGKRAVRLAGDHGFRLMQVPAEGVALRGVGGAAPPRPPATQASGRGKASPRPGTSLQPAGCPLLAPPFFLSFLVTLPSMLNSVFLLSPPKSTQNTLLH